MALYFPQDTPIELGPTGILTRSQYYNKDVGSGAQKFGCGRFSHKDVSEGVPAKYWGVKEYPLSCRAGTIVLIHYDIWHRGAANFSTDGVRFMFKFQFSRMLSPARCPCSWDYHNVVPDWDGFVNTGEQKDRSSPATVRGQLYKPIWQGIWDWLCGDTCKSDASQNGAREVETIWKLAPEIVNRSVDDAREPRRVAIAWTLGNLAAKTAENASVLVEALESLGGLESRAAMQALEAAGAKVIEPLTKQWSRPLSSSEVRALGRVVDTTTCNADQCLVALAADRLCSLYSTDSEIDVRLCIAEALGCVPLSKSAHTLLHILTQDGTGDVRATACYSLLRLLAAGVLDDVEFQSIVRKTMLAAHHDCDRYVTAYAAEFLHRLEHRDNMICTQSIPCLIRWCSHGDGWQAHQKKNPNATRL